MEESRSDIVHRVWKIWLNFHLDQNVFLKPTLQSALHNN